MNTFGSGTSNYVCDGHNERAEIVTHPRRYARCARHVSQRCSYFVLLPDAPASGNPQPPARAWLRNATNTPQMGNNIKNNSNPSSFFSKKNGFQLKRKNNRDKDIQPQQLGQEEIINPPNCQCGAPAARRTVRKEGPNHGKHFFVCPRPPQDQCRFFEWANVVVPANQRTNHANSSDNNRKRTTMESMQQVQQYAPQPQKQKTTLMLDLEDIDTFTFTLYNNSPQNLKQTIQEFSHATVTNSSMLGVKKIAIPLSTVDEFSSFITTHANAAIDFSMPSHLISRIRQYADAEQRREKSGDIVTRSLDDILPPKVCEKLMQFQWHGVHFALKRGARCLIGDDMGLGKTLQAIAIARVYMDDWPLLIVSPSSLRLNWKEELLNWLEEDIQSDEINVIMTGKDINNPLKRVNIVSYDLIRKIPSRFLQRCKFIIADESHYLKSITAKRSKALIPLLKASKRALLLSGTPALSRPVELFPQINAIAPVLFPNYHEYVQRYCNAHQGRFGYDVSGASNLNELHTVLRSSILIRRTKEEVLTQLPEKQRQVLWVQTKPSVMKDVNKLFKKFEKLKVDVENAESDGRAILLRNELKVVQNELYSLTATAKLDAILEVCKDTADAGCKFIVFAHHHQVVERVEQYLTKTLKLGFIRIDGRTAQSSRQSLCKKFQTETSCRVALLSITAAGVGLTLTKASVVLFAELYWNPGSLLQAEDRAHRIGQRDCVFVKYLLARKTYDESMWNTVKRKLTVVGHSLTGTAGKMDVTENKEDKLDKPVTHGPLDSFFKKKKRDEPTQTNDTPIVTEDVIDIDAIEDMASVLESQKELDTLPENENSNNDIQNDTCEVIDLEEMFPPLQTREEINCPKLTTTNSRMPSIVISDIVDLEEAFQLQQQLDADTSLAKRLQAQFDEEQALLQD